MYLHSFINITSLLHRALLTPQRKHIRRGRPPTILRPGRRRRPSAGRPPPLPLPSFTSQDGDDDQQPVGGSGDHLPAPLVSSGDREAQPLQKPRGRRTETPVGRSCRHWPPFYRLRAFKTPTAAPPLHFRLATPAPPAAQRAASVAGRRGTAPRHPPPAPPPQPRH